MERTWLTQLNGAPCDGTPAAVRTSKPSFDSQNLPPRGGGSALERSAAIERERREIRSLRARYEALIAREREVLGPVVAGLLNKLIADRFGIAETTIKAHRGRLMEKMRAASLADLLRMSERLGLAPDADPPQR
jgi:FixJ family two-component response regulator